MLWLFWIFLPLQVKLYMGSLLLPALAQMALTTGTRNGPMPQAMSWVLPCVRILQLQTSSWTSLQSKFIQAHLLRLSQPKSMIKWMFIELKAMVNEKQRLPCHFTHYLWQASSEASNYSTPLSNSSLPSQPLLLVFISLNEMFLLIPHYLIYFWSAKQLHPRS